TNPDIIYCQWQYGFLNRYERNSGETLDVQPQPEEGEILKWNWNSALIISPHDHQRLYYACQKIFRSDDMGDSWTRISGDLTTGVDRNELEVMGRIWSVDAVAKNNSTSFYGSIISLNESPLREGLLMAGTDDGLIQITLDGGGEWTEHGSFNGVPDGCYVSDVEPSRFDEKVIYASFDNHKRDDFKPYILRSDDYGNSWKSIAGNLPENGTVHSIALDHVDPQLVFVGTEFGVFFTRDEGANWTQLKAGIPTIACRDIEIQRRENDLVVASFGRGFYILDDYSPLRNLEPATLEQEVTIFPVKDALIFNIAGPLGYRDKGFQGDAFYTAKNPPFGAVITYHLKEGLQSLKEMRQEKEKELVEAAEPVHYPGWDDLRAEDREVDPVLLLTVRDADGEVVRRFTGPGAAGLHRVAWNLRYPYSGPINLNQGGPSSPWDEERAGPLVMPGQYSVTISRRVRGEETVLAGPVAFNTRSLGLNTTANPDHEGTLAFRKKADELFRAVQGATRTYRDADNRLKHIRQAVKVTPELDTALLDEVDGLVIRLADLGVKLNGDRTVSRRSEPTTPSINGRASWIVYGVQNNTSGPTRTMRDNLALTGELFAPVLADLTTLVTVDLKELEDRLEAAGAPYTPGRIPVWKAGD
ncbi:MAG: glycosyl hydrolase, partial [Candidatus Krumholzibacteriota bacterium]